MDKQPEEQKKKLEELSLELENCKKAEKKAINDVRAIENKFRTLYSNSPIPYQSLNKERKIIDVNPKWCQETGYSFKEAIGKDFEQFLDPYSRTVFSEDFKELLRNKQNIRSQLRLITKGGKTITVLYEGCTSSTTDGEFLHINCIFQDITAQIEAEEERKRVSELEKLRADIWKSSADIKDERELIQTLLDTAGPVLESENIAYMPFAKDSKKIVVELLWRADGQKTGIGDVVPAEIFKRIVGKSHFYFSFENLPSFAKAVLLPFRKKYGTKSSLVVPYGNPESPEGFISSQTFTYNKEYSESEINIFIELANIIHNKSRQIHSNEKLRLSNINLQTFFNTIDDFLFILDEKSNIIEYNNKVIERLKYSKEELLGNSVLVVHPEERHDEAVRIVSQMLEKEVDFSHIPLISKTGELIPVETYFTHGTWNGKPALFGVSKDISALKLSEEKFAKVFYSNPTFGIISNMDTCKITEVNRSDCENLGYKPAELIGNKLLDVLFADISVKNAVN